MARSLYVDENVSQHEQRRLEQKQKPSMTIRKKTVKKKKKHMMIKTEGIKSNLGERSIKVTPKIKIYDDSRRA